MDNLRDREEIEKKKKELMDADVWKKIEELNSKMERGVKNIKKYTDYAQIPRRIEAFYEVYPQGAIRRSITHGDDGKVIVEAKVYALGDDESTLLANGFSCKVPAEKGVDKKSFLENAETKAVGRALRHAGFGLLENYELCKIPKKDSYGNVVSEDDYVRVESRVKEFRKKYPLGRIYSEIIMDKKFINQNTSQEDEAVIFRSRIYMTPFDKCLGLYRSEGTAQEIRSDGYVNPTFLFENAETSSIGRALAIGGIILGDTVASSDEIEYNPDLLDDEAFLEEESVAEEVIGEEGKKEIIDLIEEYHQEDNTQAYLKMLEVDDFSKLTRKKADGFKKDLKKQAEKHKE